MNILIATTSFPDSRNNDFGGKFVLNEAMAYALNAASVRVVTPHQPGALKKERLHEHLQVLRFRYFLPTRLQRLKIPNKPMYGQRSPLSLFQIPLLLAVFALQLLRHGPWADVIHCQWTLTALLALPCKWLFRKKVVLTARGSDIRLLPGIVNRFIHARVDAVIDCYGDQKWTTEYKRNFPANHIKLPLIVDRTVTASDRMPPDMSEALKAGDDVFNIIYLGRFDQVKLDDGLPILTLIEAARILDRDHDNFHIFFIGDGDAHIKAAMTDRVKQYRLDHCITFLGAKKNVNSYLQFCDLGVGGISFNAVSQEFSGLKKAQLLFLGGYNQETPWKDKINTLFVEPENIPGLAEAITYAMADKVRLKEIGNRAYQLVERYVNDLNKGGAVYLQAFFDVLTEGRK